MNTFTFYEKTILDGINFDGYSLANTGVLTDYDKVHEVYKIFTVEYTGAFNKHLTRETLFTEWLQGLPSSIDIPFYNSDILANANKNGFNLITEQAEDNFLESYWASLSNAFFTLKNNL